MIPSSGLSEDKETTDKETTHLNYRQLFQKLSPFLSNRKRHILGVVFLVLVAALSGRFIPFFIGYTIDHAILQKDWDLLVYCTLGYAFLELLNAGLEFMQVFYFQKLGNQILLDIRAKILFVIQRIPMTYFNKTPAGRIVTRATNDVSQIGEIFSDGVVKVFIQFIVLISIVVSMMLISVKLTLICLITTPLFFFLGIKVTNRIRETLRTSKIATSALNSFIAESLSGMKIIQMYQLSKRKMHEFQKLSDDLKIVSLKSVKNYALMMPILNIFNGLILASALYFGGFLGQEDGLKVGLIVTFFLHALDFVHPFREIIEKYQQFQNSLTSAERVFTLLEEPIEPGYTIVEVVPQMNSSIELKHLDFRYSENSPAILKGISLVIPQRQSVGVVGRTGAGKSTLVNLLLNLYPPPKDKVFIGGQPIESIPLNQLRKQINCVQQDLFLFKGTVMENLTLGSAEIPVERVERVASEIGLTSYLAKTNRSLSYIVEESGANLSTGEKQLISFARILIFDPEIVILDEATSNIDSHLEQLLQAASRKLIQNRTSIVIAHRLSTIFNCDRIVVLDDGRVIEDGSPQKLVSEDSVFKQMLADQSYQE
ncbi:MAG: ABC transporter ATP-binding protein [Bdellovibrionaceae bacterium]|nr:ABC transporter ATP-binding protein [Pseudobdellovibrionaceae bacterium]